MRRTPLESEERRRQAIAALARGLTQKEVAALLETSVASVSQWKMRFHRNGADDLAAKRQGRPPRLAAGSTMDAVRAALLAGPPETQGLRAGLWDGASVATIVERVTGARASRWTVARYLDAWGLAPPAFATPPSAWLNDPVAAAGAATTVIVQGGPGPDAAHWLLWARRPRGEWSVLVHARAPTPGDMAAFVARLLNRWPAPLSLVAPPGDPFWTATLLDRPDARWPDGCAIRIARGHPHQKTLVTLS